ncbi:MAG TPA: DUF2231 domain-containing protein [Nocardioides sp.]|uniref:DUF2231 domain-containing protein n=1 Tax=Nocardioides sp. TaxID=35761 RepID=UPI002F3E20E7
MEFNGLPLHPLIVHVVVVFAPLAGIGGILYAAVPRWRWWLRWPLVACAVISAAAGIVAVQSGQSLENQRQLQTLPELATHAARGRFLRWVMLAFLVPTALAVWQLGGPSPLATDGRSRTGRTGVVAWAIQLVLLAGAVTVLVCVFLTGDAGSRAVWGR